MNDKPSSLSPEEIFRKIRELNEEEPWFHCIDLGNGILTREPVAHLSKLWGEMQKHLPDDLSEMSVLDIGCNAGFFTTSVKRKGAGSVLGIDMSPSYLRQAEFVKDVLDLEIEYKPMSIYQLRDLGLSFDITLCLGVIYHCVNPFAAARSVWSVTSRMAIVESAIIDDTSDKPLWELVFPGYEKGDDGCNEAERCYNWWFPNIAGLKALFLRAGFSKVETMFASGDRGSIVCLK